MKLLDKYKHHPAVWLLVFIAMLAVWLFAVAFFISAVAGCEGASPGCVPNDLTCSDHEILRCNADGRWIQASNCRDFADMDAFESLAYTCCTIEGVTDCYLEASCLLVERFCENADAWVESYCGGI